LTLRVSKILMALKLDPSLGLPTATVAQAYLGSVEGATIAQPIDPRTLAVHSARVDEYDEKITSGRWCFHDF
jgi:hypothetical protein